MKRGHLFLNNCDARIPFSILGIFLLLGSSVTGLVISEMQTSKIITYIDGNDADDLSLLVFDAEADIGRIVNMIGIRSLSSIARNPVIESVSYLSAEEVNKLRLKKQIISELNGYLLSNYLNENFNNGRYAINIVVPENQFYPLNRSKMISISELKMKLSRPVHLPFLGPYEENIHPAYWKVSFDLPVHIVDLSDPSDMNRVRYNLNISTIINVRYPLLKHLMNEYNETINGLGPLWVTSSLLSNIYSLARGYKHYQSGKPLNVVTNEHLTPIINTGLLLEEGLVFGSVDPGFCINLIGEVQQALRKKNPVSEVDRCNNLVGDSFSLAVSTFSDIPIKGNNDANDLIDDADLINISDIASHPLYLFHTIRLIFSDQSGHIEEVVLSDPTQNKIKQCIESYVMNGYILEKKELMDDSRNSSTIEKVHQLINTMYTATFSSYVQRDDSPIKIFGDHEGYPIDNGTSTWSIDSINLTRIIGKKGKGLIQINSSVYSEIYDVIWKRNHIWSKKETVEQGNETVVKWSSISVEDIKVEENVIISIYLDRYGNNHDVYDVFYENEIFQDINLKDTFESYNSSVFQPQVTNLLRYDEGWYQTHSIQGQIPDWVEETVWNEFDDLFELISCIKLSEDITVSHYPNPIELLTAAKNDISMNYSSLKSSLLSMESFIEDDCFKSVGWNAVFSCRQWYVNEVEEKIDRFFNGLIEQIDDQITNAASSVDGISGNDMKQALCSDSVGSLGDMISVPLGYDLQLSLLGDEKNSFAEPLTLAVDHYPSYLTPFEKQESVDGEEFFLEIENICTLGPTGLPLLPPTPTTPWIVTLNIWIIRVKGWYETFELTDCNQETRFHPLLGHVPLVYCRKQAPVYDSDGVLLGFNKPISFSLDLVAFSLVPSWGMMVGDVEGGLTEQDGKS